MHICLTPQGRTKYFKSLRLYLATRSVRWWTIRISLLLIAYLGMSFTASTVANAPSNFSAWLAKIKHTPELQTARLFLGGYGSYKAAQRYYESQKPMIEEAMQNTMLHPFWARTQERLSGRETWQDMVVGRMAGMVKQLNTLGRDDFKVEKDKCEMYGFLQRNELPFVPLVGMWSEKDQLLEFLDKLRSEIASKGTISGGHSFPLWLKSCHLTQGDDAGRRMIKVSDLTDEGAFVALTDWISRKAEQRPNDDARAWSKDAKKILDTLKPRFLIQGSYDPPYGDSVGFPKKAPVELKIEVLWGRAYLANICDYEAYALRDGTVERWDTSLFSKIAHAPVTSKEANKQVEWLQSEGHLEKAFELAEKVCQAMMADQVRVDIFVRPGDPNAVLVNEISISPGALYKWHAQFMAAAWRGGHVEHRYRLSSTSSKVYEEGPIKGHLQNGEKWFEKE
mmetsp:Transcript_9589/g.23598  ORF Transcript_9589/g.23598 Transcript_9589/m.23598 type:complete len:451 (-) Transcript_9589:314-1666(-)